MEFNTKLLHGNNQPDKATGATMTPIYQSTAFSHKSAEELESVFNDGAPGYLYSRINNPTVDSFERRVALLEKGIGAAACSSGMSAIALGVLNLLKQGDELVSSAGIFGGTYSLFKGLADYGITARFSETTEVDGLAQLITDKTRLLFVEIIGNPKLDVPNIAALADLAHSHKIPLVVDNTVASPCMFRPLEHGADIVIHSTSKLINGGGNSIGGIIVDKGRFPWSEEKFPELYELKRKYTLLAYLSKLRKGLHRDMGACMAPFNAYLNSVGMETLGLRVERSCLNALELAKFLEQHPQVAWVNYPGLRSSPYHQLAHDQFAGCFGSLLTFGTGSKENSFRTINRLKYAHNLANIGDIRTLVIHPASTIYTTYSLEDRAVMGVTEDMIRVSVGIEDLQDLLGDFDQALKEG